MVVAIDMAEQEGGNSVILRELGRMGVEDAEPPKQPAAERTRSELPTSPVVRPRDFLASNPDGRLPYKYVETLRNISDKYSLDIVSEIQFKEIRSLGASSGRQKAYRTLLRPELPVGEALDAIATIFGFRYEFRNGAHFMRNDKWFWEEKYAHTDDELERVQRLPKEQLARLDTMAKLMDLSASKVEGLSMVIPEMRRMVEMRKQVELYASLTAEQRRTLLMKGELPASALSREQLARFWAMISMPTVLLPPDAFAFFHLEWQASTKSDALGYRLTLRGANAGQ